MSDVVANVHNLLVEALSLHTPMEVAVEHNKDVLIAPLFVGPIIVTCFTIAVVLFLMVSIVIHFVRFLCPP